MPKAWKLSAMFKLSKVNRPYSSLILTFSRREKEKYFLFPWERIKVRAV
jgi:hypothetical protein